MSCRCCGRRCEVLPKTIKCWAGNYGESVSVASRHHQANYLVLKLPIVATSLEQKLARKPGANSGDLLLDDLFQRPEWYIYVEIERHLFICLAVDCIQPVVIVTVGT
jgi:hypothetical protein